MRGGSDLRRCRRSGARARPGASIRRVAPRRLPAGAASHPRPSRARADRISRAACCMLRGISSRTYPPPAALAAIIASRVMSSMSWSGTSRRGRGTSEPPGPGRCALYVIGQQLTGRDVGMLNARRSLRPVSLCPRRGARSSVSAAREPVGEPDAVLPGSVLRRIEVLAVHAVGEHPLGVARRRARAGLPFDERLQPGVPEGAWLVSAPGRGFTSTRVVYGVADPVVTGLPVLGVFLGVWTCPCIICAPRSLAALLGPRENSPEETCAA
jgi:hypothetical protein